MALLRSSSPVGTSTSASANTNDTSRSISTASTTTTTTTIPNKTTTTTTATNRKQQSAQSPSATTTTATFLAHTTSILISTLKTLYQTHRLLLSLIFSTCILLLVRCLSALHLLGYTLLLFFKFSVYRTLLFFRIITMETASLTWSIWDSRKARQIRKKIEFEFFVWILGPGGNLLCFLLWPGWIVLGLMVWGVSCLMTGVSAAVVSG